MVAIMQKAFPNAFLERKIYLLYMCEFGRVITEPHCKTTKMLQIYSLNDVAI